MNNLTEDLTKVRDYFIEYGGATGTVYDVNTGRVCMMGAAIRCSNVNVIRVTQALQAQLPVRDDDGDIIDVAYFNDCLSTFNERVAVFDAAIIASKEAES